MKISGFSTNGLLMLHESISKALADDDSIGNGNLKPYEVRECSDWKEMSDAIENELTSRTIFFTKILW